MVSSMHTCLSDSDVPSLSSLIAQIPQHPHPVLGTEQVHINHLVTYPLPSSCMSPSTKTIDHLVHLTPPGSLEETSKQFRELGFKCEDLYSSSIDRILTWKAVLFLEAGMLVV